MDSVQMTLIVLLAVGYITLLVLTIIAVVLVIQILQSIRHITQKAEATTNNFSELISSLGAKVAPAALTAVLNMITKRFKKSRSSDDED